MKKIVIIGAGFGGIYTCKYLLKKLDSFEIILINKSNYFIFTPLIHEVATGGLNVHTTIQPIREILNSKNFRFLRAEVKEIDFSKKKIFLDHESINYDYLVLSIGATTNFYNIKGAKEYSLTLKNIEDAIKIRKKIIASLENSILTDNKEKIKELLTFVIIGAGPTGIELIAEIEEFIRQNLKYNYKVDKSLISIILIQKGPKILPHLDEQHIKLTEKKLEEKNIKIMKNSSVTEIGNNFIIINDKEKIKTCNVVWTAGVTPNIIKTTPKIANEKNFFEVNKFLEVKKLQNVFAIGDCALFFDENKNEYAPLLAQVATKQAKIAVYNIISKIKNKKLKEYKLRLSGFLLSVGQGFAVAEIGGIHFTGKFAWFIWRTIYLFKVVGIKNKIRVGIDWAINLIFRRDTDEI